ncbi:MAG: caspase family protein [Acidobacteriota bacterium]
MEFLASRFVTIVSIGVFIVSTVLADCETFGDPLGNTPKALIIGNASYTKPGIPPLRGASKDADAMQKAFSAAGYAGVRCDDVSASKIEEQVNLFLDATNGLLRPTDTFLFYFSGHGSWVQSSNVNLLYGVGANNLKGQYESYSLQKLLDAAVARDQAMHVIIVDACRLQVIPKGGGAVGTATLKPFNPPRGVYIAYAAAEGAPALTNGERLSPFTAALAQELELEAKSAAETERDIDLLFRRVRARVVVDWPMEPWTSHNMTGSFTFRRGEVKSITEDLPQKAPRAVASARQGADDWCDGFDVALDRIWDRPESKLRLPFLATDVLRLQLCEGPPAALEQIQEGLNSGSLVTLPLAESAAKKLLGARWPKLTLSYDTACNDLTLPDCRRVTEVVLTKEDASKLKAMAGGGKLAFLALHWGKRGHYEITRTALSQVNPQLPPQVVQIVSDASQDADFWEWGNPAAHGQSKQDKNLRPSSVQKSQEDFIDWEVRSIGRVAENCAKPRAALYYLGYALHGIQDLVFHGGMTNAEHAHRDYVGPAAVDTEEDYAVKFAAAANVSAELIRRVLARVPCAAAMTSYQEGGWLSVSEKRELFKNRSRDFSVSAVLEFRKYASRVKNAIASGQKTEDFYLEPRWINHRDLASVTAYLDKIAPPPPEVAPPVPDATVPAATVPAVPAPPPIGS